MEGESRLRGIKTPAANVWGFARVSVMQGVKTHAKEMGHKQNPSEGIQIKLPVAASSATQK